MVHSDSLIKMLHPKIQSDIVTFPVSSLHHVTLEIKQSLPTAEGIKFMTLMKDH